MTYNTALTIFLFVTAVAAYFNETPASQEVVADSNAVFRCQHPTADIIGWTVNNTSIGANPSPDITPTTIRDEENNLVHILTIIARPQYNETTIVCVAVFLSGAPSETTAPVVLLVQGIQTSSPIPTTTTPAAPGVQEFTLSPTSKNVTLGTVATFECRHPTARFVGWIINGTPVQLSLPEISLTTSGDTYILSITAQSQFNASEIECEAFFRDAPSLFSDTAIMMIQGKLSHVTDLARVNSTTISWEPPFSLDFTDVDPDIVYCVEVYNVTDCEKRELLTGDCNVIVTNYTIPHDIGSGRNDIFEYTVTPRSNVAGSVNGTRSLPLKSHSLRFTMNEPSLKPKNENITDHITKLSFNVNDLPIPSNYTLLLDPVDGVGNGEREMIPANTTLDEILLHLYLRIPQLNRKRLWRCSILAFGCSDLELLLNQPEVYLSTHDIQGVHVTSSQPGELSVDGYFIKDSTASGVLVIASDGRNTSYHFIDRDSDRLNGDTRVMGLPGGKYIVSVFVVKEDGLAVKRAAAIPNNLNVTNDNGANPSSSIDYELQSTSTGVCITCTFLESSTATDCVAVVHQRISQLNSSAGLMNIESSHKFTRSDDTASGCIEGVNLEDYQVGVIGWRQFQSGSGTVPSKITTIVGVSVGVGVVIVLLLVVILVLVIRNWDHLKSHMQKGEPASPNEYEPSPPTINPKARLVVADGGNHDTMAGGPPPPPPTTSATGTVALVVGGGGGTFVQEVSDGGNHDIVINMAGSPASPPQYSTLFHPGTTRSTGLSVGGQENEAMYSTPAEASDSAYVQVATDDQGNHSDIKHEEINGEQYAVVNKPKKESKDSDSSKGTKKPLVYSELDVVAPPVRVPPTADKPVAYCTVQLEKGENGEQQAVVDKQESGGDGSVGEAVKESKSTVIYSTPKLKRPAVNMPLNDDRVKYAVVKEPKDQTLSPKTKEVSHQDKRPLPGQTQLTPRLIHVHSRIASNTDSGIGHSDSDSRSSALSNSSDDEEFVQQSETTSEPVTSSPVQQQTTDLEQGTCVHQASDGRTHVRQTNNYENAPLNFLGEEQVVGMDVDPVRTGDEQVHQDVDPVRTGDKVVFEDDDELVPAVSCFQSDVATTCSHEICVTDESVEPGLPSEPEQTDYMEMLSACSSSNLNISLSERVRLLRHRRARSNHESDELWQSQAETYSTLSESGNSEDQEVVTTGMCENVKDTEDGVTKQVVLYVAHVQMKVRFTVNV